MKKLIKMNVLMFLLIAACEDPLKVEDNVANRIDGIDLNFETILQDQTTFPENNETNFLVFRSQNEEDNFVQNNSITKTPWESVDYSSEMVIGIAMKPQPTGSNIINIDSLTLEDNTIVVHSTFTIPGIGNSMIGHPVHFIKLKKYDNLVEFATINVIKAPSNFELNGTKWELVRFIANGNEYDQNNAANYFGDEAILSEAFLEFYENNRFGGYSFCNEIVDGNYDINSSNGSINFGFASTEIACTGTSEFQTALFETYSYEADENSLILYSNDKITTLFFTPKMEGYPDQINLENTEWKLNYWIDFNGNIRKDVNGNYNFGPQVDMMDNILKFETDGEFGALQFQKIMEGAYTTNKSTLGFEIIESHGENSDFTELFRNSLLSTLSYYAKEDSLFIRSNNNIVKEMVFERYKFNEESYNGFYGNWELTYVINAQNEQTETAPNTNTDENSISLNLSEDGTLSGTAICNEYFGDFMHGNSSFVTKPLASTKALCPPSSKYIGSLSKAFAFEKRDGQLFIFTNDEDYAVMIFNRK